MPLYLHRAQRSDALVTGLADMLAAPLPDPMATEVIAVPARGIERWLTQRLSHTLGPTAGDDGVCANVDFAPPAAIVQRAISAATGVDPDTDPWRPERLRWEILATVDDAIAELWALPLARHLGGASDEPADEVRRSRRLTVATRIAELFAGYGRQRPTILQDWAAGQDTDGAGRTLAPQRLWQPELFRRVRERVATASPAERLDAASAALRGDPSLSDLPARLSVFGPTRLSAQELAVLAALSAGRDVHLWIPQPSPTLWAGLTMESPTVLGRRRDDVLAGRPRHPLLRSLGRDSRELLARLATVDAVIVDAVHPDSASADHALGRLQASLSANQAPPGAPIAGLPDQRAVLAVADRSVQVHACHGRARQVEVLREVLVGLLADDPTLQPRDILVMCPDIEAYAPFVLAAFGTPGDDDGLAGGHPGTRIRVRLADRALRQTNPVLDVLARVLELAAGRVTASEVLDLAGLAPVRHRFAFDDDDLARLREWVTAAGIRWGLNAASRERYGLQRLPQNTWRAGLDRILLGVTMSEDEPTHLGLALPLDDVDSSDIDLAGRLAELVDRLALTLTELSKPQPLTGWVTALHATIDRLAAATESGLWQLDQARRILGDALVSADGHTDVTLRLADVVGLLADQLRGRPTRANFRTGELTICSMVPMRSVPHRVVCLMGLDDGEFPRAGRIDGDDVLAFDPLVGERDATSEDRQLLLDAIDAATENLVFLYSGADERTGAPRPPAAALGEIVDVLDASFVTADGDTIRRQLVVEHPLQPFDPRNFAAGGVRPDVPFSFDAAARAGAAAGTFVTDRAETFLPVPLPPIEPDQVVEVDALVRFFESPAKAFLRRRLGLYLGGDNTDVPDELSLSVDGLGEWAIGDRMLAGRLAGAGLDALRQAEYRRGDLPPGALAGTTLDRIAGRVGAVAGQALRVIGDHPEQLDVAIELDDGRLVAGSVGPVHGDSLTRVVYSALKAKHKVAEWIRLLALAAADPHGRKLAIVVARERSDGVAVTLTAPPAAMARTFLTELVAIRDEGLAGPLPLEAESSYLYARRRGYGVDVETSMQQAGVNWDSSFDGRKAVEHQRIWGDVPLAAAATTLGGSGAEGGRWGEIARAVYDPVLRAEGVSQ